MKRVVLSIFSFFLFSSMCLCFSSCKKSNIKSIIIIGWDESSFNLGDFEIKNYIYNATSAEFVVIDEDKFLETIKSDERMVGEVKFPNMLNVKETGYLFFENNNYYLIVKHPTEEKHYHIESCIASLNTNNFIYEFPMYTKASPNKTTPCSTT